MNLHLDWCSRNTAKFAVKHWHYSQTMPPSKNASIGVWEDGVFVRAIIYGLGSGWTTSGRRFGLAPRFEIAELTRVALKPHKTSTSRILSISMRMIQKAFPRLRMLVSYADRGQGHIGILYQATNWICIHTEVKTHRLKFNGKIEHPRTVVSRYGTGSVEWLRKHVDAKASIVKVANKILYAYPFDKDMRSTLESMRVPYIKDIAS